MLIIFLRLHRKPRFTTGFFCYHFFMVEQEYFFENYPLADVFTIENDIQIVYVVNPDAPCPYHAVTIAWLSTVNIPKYHRLKIIDEIRQI